MSTDNRDIEEDEDVIIQGTSLYEHLHNLGYMDFESITVCQSPKEKERNSRLIGFIHCIKHIFKKIYVVYSRIVQDDSVSKKQVEAILNAKVLLSDHACAIQSFLDKYECKSWRSSLSEFLLCGTVFSSFIYILNSILHKPTTSLLASLTLLCIGSIKSSRVYAHGELNSLVSLQNDLLDLCKKGLKILRYGFKIKLSKGNCPQQFYDFTEEKLQYLQPIIENLINCFHRASCAYYCVSLILKKLLPVNVVHEDLLTRFEFESFELRGEINYQKLKHLYHVYILTQSEMLHLLAIAYDSHTWQQFCNKMPELKLAYIVHSLIGRLRTYKSKLSNVINDYYSFKAVPILHKYKGPAASQWQDLYMHLYLAANKLQLAYSHISSILDDIDNNVDETVSNEDSAEKTMLTMNEIQKNIEAAKSFIEFSNLFLVRARIRNHTGNPSEVNILTPASNADLPILNDSEPEIMDEVFEEYIKEEYLKPLSEETDEICLYNSKRDKLLFKNFMTELKDALIDKQKSMSERESKALERMYKNIMKGNNLKDDCHRIPIAPPMPPFNMNSLAEQEIAIDRANCDTSETTRLSEKVKIVKPFSEQENLTQKHLCDSFTPDEHPVSLMSLPKMQLDSKNKNCPSFLPTPFLKANEETFTGSGENSEDEIVECNSDQ